MSQSRWGSHDERGALNLLTEQVVRSALTSVTRGRVYQLGIPIQHAGVPVVEYRGAPHRLTLATAHDGDLWATRDAPPGTGANEDVLFMAAHNGTHMDALSHVYADGKLYNGFPASSFTPNGGAARCGIQTAGPIVARAVVLDLPALLGVPWLPGDQRVGEEMLRQAQDRQDIEIRSGDVLLVRTGWMDYFWDCQRTGVSPDRRQPGLNRSGAEYVLEKDVAVVGADNWAVECLPSDGGFLSVHVALQVRGGIPFIENLDLGGALTRDGVQEGLFVASPLRITGGSGSPVNPILVA